MANTYSGGAAGSSTPWAPTRSYMGGPLTGLPLVLSRGPWSGSGAAPTAGGFIWRMPAFMRPMAFGWTATSATGSPTFTSLGRPATVGGSAVASFCNTTVNLATYPTGLVTPETATAWLQRKEPVDGSNTEASDYNDPWIPARRDRRGTGTALQAGLPFEFANPSAAQVAGGWWGPNTMDTRTSARVYLQVSWSGTWTAVTGLCFWVMLFPVDHVHNDPAND